MLLFSYPVYATGYIAVATGCQQAVKNGETVVLDERDPSIYPIIKNERMFIPVRCVAELFGAEVGWEPETQTVYINYNGTFASFAIGEKSEILGIDEPAFICEDAAFIPVRAAAENILGLNVEYFPEIRTAVISGGEITDDLGVQCYELLCKYEVQQDDKHYIINNRRYKIAGYVGDIPQIYYNYQMIDDKLKNDLSSLMKDVEFTYNTLTRNGDKTERKGIITVNKYIADEVSEILFEIKEQGGILRQGDFGSFRISKTDFDDFGRMKHPNHPNGLAIDLNSVDNPYTFRESDGSIRMLTDDSGATESYVFYENSAVVRIFEEHEWVWGGNWRGKYRDYMHFSLNGC
jgi:hypothetical protein